MRQVLGLLMGLMTAIAFPQVVHATCNPQSQNAVGNWHAGAVNDAYPTVNGVTAYIYEYRPYVDNWGTNGSLGWVMLNDGGLRWAQVGYWEDGGIFNTHHTFVQFTPVDSSHHETFLFDPEPDWTYTQTTVLYEPVSGQMKWRFYSDNVLLMTTAAWWDPQEAQVSSEIMDLGNQMPGDWGQQHWQRFHSMQKRTNQWYAFAPTAVLTSNNNLWYASNTRGGMDPLRELVTADRRGDCS